MVQVWKPILVIAACWLLYLFYEWRQEDLKKGDEHWQKALEIQGTDGKADEYYAHMDAAADHYFWAGAYITSGIALIILVIGVIVIF